MATTKVTKGVIADNAVGIDQLDVTDGSNGQVLSTDGSGTLSFSTVTSYTDSDARSAISAGTGISYDSSTGVITNTVSDTDTTYSAGTGLSLSGTTFSSTITQYDDSDARSAISAGTGISYDSSTGVITNSSIADGITASGSNTIIQSPDNTNVIHVNDSANVGIGTTNPQGDLTLSNAGAEGIEFYAASGGNINATQHYNRSGAVYVTNKVIAADHQFFIAGSEKMRIDSSGRVGINRTPSIGSSKLEVGGADNVPLINVEASGYTGGMGIGSTGLQLFHGTTARMTITSTGQITAPNQPSFFCYPTSSFTASGGSVKYTFASESHDSNNEYNHTTGKFTAPIAGRYMFLCNLAIQSSTSELTYAGIGVRKNNTGSVFFGGWTGKPATTSSHYGQTSSSIIMYLAQGDYVELYIELSGSHTILGGNDGSYTRFCGQLLS